MRTTVTAGIVLAALAAFPVAASAATPAAPADRPAMAGAVRDFLAPPVTAARVQSEGALSAGAPRLSLGSARVSTVDPRFGTVAVRGPGIGDRVAVLARTGRGWRTLDVGPRSVGCGLMGARALRDLGMSCPAG